MDHGFLFRFLDPKLSECLELVMGTWVLFVRSSWINLASDENLGVTLS